MILLHELADRLLRAGKMMAWHMLIVRNGSEQIAADAAVKSSGRGLIDARLLGEN